MDWSKFANPQYARENGTYLEIDEFNEGVKDGTITDAKMDALGNGYGEPYNPIRTVWGWRGKELVWSEVRRDRQNRGR